MVSAAIAPAGSTVATTEPKKKHAVTIKDIAKIAGVHFTTVSLALRDHPSLRHPKRRASRLMHSMEGISIRGVSSDTPGRNRMTYRPGTAGKTSCAAHSPIFIRSVFIEIRRSGHPPIRPIEYRKKSRTVQIAVRLFVRQSETKSRRANRRDLPLSGRLQVTGYRTYLSL